MPSEPPLHEAQGVLVLAREIIAHGQTIPIRDVREVRIQAAGPSQLILAALGTLLLLMIGAAAFYAFQGELLGVLSLSLVGTAMALALGMAIYVAILFRRKALVVVTPQGKTVLTHARSEGGLEPLLQAIRAAVGVAGGESAVPRWGSALRDAANAPPSASSDTTSS